ncbi:hypothetical protein G6F70_001371 [Rhizopus microsporus]|nr:hypothetical protein G6F71_007860 [Rhizopus microsporus]KAG1203429.1 hypothetical protein G6F70_001371 [Rhizopus microsporus]KAG1215030.1 hypothetical protein G6F69_001365 [Rhizopus microsporus]KAG1229351.1 hypothetical protein G6F67_007207 [Rhizopus microsporus]KAG1260586.1 hypothetical protein G6F68_007337 [Rhizopus microsporus]
MNRIGSDESLTGLNGEAALIAREKLQELLKEYHPEPYISSNQSEKCLNYIRNQLKYPTVNDRSIAPSTTVTAPPSFLIACKDTVLEYTIHDYSSYSLYYHPQNILTNKPTEQLSRWSSSARDNQQYITIKFKRPVIARSITFGKYHQSHVCNLKEFKVLGGLDLESDMLELFHGGLKNDTKSETFDLKHQYKNMIVPVQYIKIIPLAAYGSSFNYSIWYLEVRGISDRSIVNKVFQEYKDFKEAETLRLCLKYFRQKNMMDVFHVLKNRIDVHLEHPILSNLHYQFVACGNFDNAEKVVKELYDANIFQAYCDKSPYVAHWKHLKPTGEQGAPCGRGGHQMCIDVKEKTIYVLGGYDGGEDLGDFWCYDIVSNSWHLLSSDTERMCYDPRTDALFVLGRYVGQTLQSSPVESDFFMYDLKQNKWIQLCDHTAKHGGPELVFDHQMCIDSHEGKIYVCGGKVINRGPNIPVHSGFYAYDIASKEWDILRLDDADTHDGSVTNRVGHSMVVDETNKTIYIFGGQRGYEYFYDMYKYNIPQNFFQEIDYGHASDISAEAGLTQRVTIDEELQEMYIFAGYTRSSRLERIRDVIYVYSIKTNTWEKVYEHEILECLPSRPDVPIPRYAHQMVYDPVSKTHYMFGGNPGGKGDLPTRLDDLWELKLRRPEASAVYNHCLFLIRMQKLRELCRETAQTLRETGNIDQKEAMAAINYLRTSVASVVNYDDEEQVNEFHEMCAKVCLFDTLDDDRSGYSGHEAVSEDALYAERSQIHEKILKYIPQEIKEPVENLTNAVKMI